MKRNVKWVAIGCGLGGVLLVGLLFAASGLLAVWAPWSSSEWAIPATPVQVSLMAPVEGAHYPLNSYIPVEARVIGPVSDIQCELWVDGVLFQVSEMQPLAGRRAQAGWHWVPADQGSHVMQVLARDGEGRVAFSNLVHVTISDAVDASAEVTIIEGDTWDALA